MTSCKYQKQSPCIERTISAEINVIKSHRSEGTVNKSCKQKKLIEKEIENHVKTRKQFLRI